MLTADRKRAFGPWLSISILTLFGVFVFDIAYYLPDRTEEAVMMLRFTGVVAPVYMIAALLCALPFATSFLTDLKTGVYVPMVLRSGSERYLQSKVVGTVLSGGLTLSLGLLLYILFLNLWFTKGCATAAEMTCDLPFFAALQSGAFSGVLTIYAAFLFIGFLAGMFWAMLAMMLSTVLSSASLILCVPPVGYRLFDELSARVLPGFLSPTLLMQAETDVSLPATLVSAAMVYGTLTALFAWLFRILARRKMRCL